VSTSQQGNPPPGRREGAALMDSRISLGALGWIATLGYFGLCGLILMLK
jgi:hypothetical protein